MNYRPLVEELNRTCNDFGVIARVGVDPRSGRRRAMQTPSGLLFPVMTGIKTKIESFVGLGEEFTRRIRLMSPGLAVEVSRMPLSVEIKREKPIPLPLPTNYLDILDLPPFVGVVGVAIQMDVSLVVSINLKDSETPHLLFCGQSGSGKSTALRSFALSMAYATPPSQLKMVLIDPKQRGLPPLEGLPHVVMTAYDTSSIMSAITWVEEETRRRIESRKDDGDVVLVVIDEGSDVVHLAATVTPSLVAAAKLGREVGVHIAIADQRPMASSLGGDLLQQLSGRVVGRLRTAREASDILGVPDPTLQQLTGNGSMVYFPGGRPQVKIQAFMPDPEILVAAILKKWPRAQPVIQLQEMTLNAGGIVKPSGKVSQTWDVQEDAEAIQDVVREYWVDGKVKRGGFVRMAAALDSDYGGSTITRIDKALKYLKEIGEIT